MMSKVVTSYWRVLSDRRAIRTSEGKRGFFDAQTPVTGQTKMQAAWSANPDDDSGAQIASAPQGQIFEQVYQPWNGELNPRWMRN